MKKTRNGHKAKSRENACRKKEENTMGERGGVKTIGGRLVRLSMEKNKKSKTVISRRAL